MPEKNGIEVLREIQKISQRNKIPLPYIIVCSVFIGYDNDIY